MDTATFTSMGASSSLFCADLSATTSVSSPDVASAGFAQASAAPSQIRWVYCGPLVEGWHLAIPLDLILEIEDSSYIVSDDVFLVYGVGATMREAFEDYACALVELLELTEASAEQNPHDRPLLARFHRYLQRRA